MSQAGVWRDGTGTAANAVKVLDCEHATRIVQGKQAIPAEQAVRRMWMPNDMAQEVGGELGRCEVLLGLAPREAENVDRQITRFLAYDISCSIIEDEPTET